MEKERAARAARTGILPERVRAAQALVEGAAKALHT
jgi:hypothetical protein